MNRDKTHPPSRTTESEQLASLRTKQERHERLAREHAASAKRVWLRRVLLELSQEKQTGNAAVKKKAKARVNQEADAATRNKACRRRRARGNDARAATDPESEPRR